MPIALNVQLSITSDTLQQTTAVNRILSADELTAFLAGRAPDVAVAALVGAAPAASADAPTASQPTQSATQGASSAPVQTSASTASTASAGTTTAPAQSTDDLAAQLAAAQAQIASLQPPPVPNQPTMRIIDVAPQPGAAFADVPIVLSEPTNTSITVVVGSYSYGADIFTPVSGRLTFNPGETVRYLKVPLLRDMRPDESFSVYVAQPQNNPPTNIATSGARVYGDPSKVTEAAPAETVVPLPAKPTGKTLTFAQDFADPAFSLSDTGTKADGSPCWQARLTHGYEQQGNSELGYYAPPDLFPNVTFTGVDADGKRFIQAERHPEGFTKPDGTKATYDFGKGPQPYVFSSALINGSRLTPDITAGTYVEARLKLSVVQGTWPAFWLLSKDGNWPPEVDIFEGFFGANGLAKDKLGTTLHWVDANGQTAMQGNTVTLSDVVPGYSSEDWHTYGVFIEQDRITYYLDDVPFMQQPNAARRNVKWYPLLNVSVGGLVGVPPADAAFPAKMGLDFLKIWN